MISMSSGKLTSFLSDFLRVKYDERESMAISMLIIEYLFGIDRSGVLLGSLVRMDENHLKAINDILVRLLADEPIQYITGRAFFYDRTFIVNREVLIPRSETEELVKIIINDVKKAKVRILDIGTGSGCIAITLAANIPQAQVTGWDISEGAITTASKNASVHNVDVRFQQVDIFNPGVHSDRFDVVVSNPPYVTKSESMLMNKNVVGFEPAVAIFVDDEDPLKYYRQIISMKNGLLVTGGKLFFELNESFGDRVVELMEKSGFGDVRLIRDIHGKDRFATGKL